MMPGPEPAALADELRALPARQRRAVLDALSAGERAQLAALLDGSSAVAEAGHDPLESLAPWLRARLREPEPDTSWKMTPAGRRLLCQAAGERLDAAAPRRAPARPSLLAIVGSLLTDRRTRR